MRYERPAIYERVKVKDPIIMGPLPISGSLPGAGG